MKKKTIWVLLVAMILSCVGCDTNEETPENMKEVVFLNSLPCIETTILETEDVGKLEQQVIVDSDGTTTNWFGKYIQTDADTLYAFCINVNESAEATLQKLTEKECHIISDYPYTYTYEGDQAIEPKITTDLYKKGTVAIAATLEELARLQEDAETDFYVTEAFRPDLVELFEEIGWKADSDSSLEEWLRIHNEDLLDKLGDESQITKGVLVDPLAYEGIPTDNTEDLATSEQNEGVLLDDEISKIIINQTTADGRYYKEFVLADDITNIKNILSDAVGEEIQEEMEPTGGRTFGVILYNSNDELVVSSYSDTVIEVGRKYYSVSDSNWVSKILEYYEMSEIVENELK